MPNLVKDFVLPTVAAILGGLAVDFLTKSHFLAIILGLVALVLTVAYLKGWPQRMLGWVVARPLAMAAAVAFFVALFTSGIVAWAMAWLMLPANPDGVHQIEFWTPSQETAKAPGIREEVNLKWLREDVGAKLNQFASELALDHNGIVGFRSYPIQTGKGTGPKEAGAWWVVTLKKGYTCGEFFNEHYLKVWKSGETGIYYEINGVGDHWTPKQGRCRIELPPAWLVHSLWG